MRRNRRNTIYIAAAGVIVCALLLAIPLLPKQHSATKSVREAQHAGSWYPGSSQKLADTTNELLAERNAEVSNPDGLIVPHAGWRFSGPVAAGAYAQLDTFDKVILLGPSHHVGFSGASVPNVSHYSTPLGTIPLMQARETLVEHASFRHHPNAHEQEHSLEVQLPFLQHHSNFSLLPVVIGPRTSMAELSDIASRLESIADEDTLIIASSDFTHYGPRYGYTPFRTNVSSRIRALDMQIFKKIKEGDPQAFLQKVQDTGATVCGAKPIAVMMHLLGNATATLIDYNTSGELTGDYSNSVSYLSAALSTSYLDKATKKKLLTLARKSIRNHITDEEEAVLDTQELPDKLQKEQGCFVTLNKRGKLRGCIGDIIPERSLYECVRNNAVNAAVNDQRFPTVKEDELDDITIEVSVLTVPQSVSFSSGEELKEKLTPEKHGVVLKSGWHQSTYLPQVWEKIPGKERFLSKLCTKGGMPADCWQDPETTVKTYQAHVFSEDDLASGEE